MQKTTCNAENTMDGAKISDKDTNLTKPLTLSILTKHHSPQPNTKATMNVFVYKR